MNGFLPMAEVDQDTIAWFEHFSVPVVEQGDRLVLEPIELLQSDHILDLANGFSRSLINDLHVFRSIGSTNTFLMEQWPKQNCHAWICLAEAQTQGRGRRGRQWVSPFGCNLYMSIGWQYLKTSGGLEGLSLLVGLKVAETLRELGLVNVGLKWPNDLLVEGRKLGGILVEIVLRPHNKLGVVIGMGINLRLPDGRAQLIDQPFTTVAEHLPDITRNLLAAKLLDNLLPALSRFQVDGFARYRHAWSQLDVFSNQQVEIRQGNDLIHGTSMGVDSHGNLMLQTRTGLATFGAGEVSLRPVD